MTSATSVLIRSGVCSEAGIPPTEEQLYVMLDMQARVPIEMLAYINLSECDSSSHHHLKCDGHSVC